MTGAAEPGAATPLTVMIAMPTLGHVATATTVSLIKLTQAFQERGIGYSFVTYQGPDIVVSRNHLMSSFLTDREFSHLLWVDSDMVFEPDAVWRLLAAGADFVAAACPQKFFDWTALRKAVEDDLLREGEEAEPFERLLSRSLTFNIQTDGFREDRWVAKRRDGYITVPAVGMGLTLISRTVPQALADAGLAASRPGMNDLPGHKGLEWHDFFGHLASEDGRLMFAEDQSFCHRWVEGCGGDIWLDCGANVGHVGPVVFEGTYDHRVQRDFPEVPATDPGIT
jgi:hypothetical protein